MEPLPEGTVTFLFSDIEGSTRRWSEDPQMADTLARHDQVLRSVIEESDGRWVKHTGDGALAVFGQASKAVEAAAEIQRSFGAETADDPIRVRIGIHTGEAERRGHDYFGLTVSAAARVMDAGHGGQVLISEATRAVLGQPGGDVELLDLGAHRLKDLGEAQHLYQLAAPGLEVDFPSLRTLEAADHNLPLQLTSFVGREDELSEVTELVRGNRLVTLTGVGGAGKTRLALQVAADLVDEFADGVWLVELAAVSDPTSVPPAVASALGVRTERYAATDLVGRIIEHLEDREVLIVLDNCEHVLGAAAGLVESLLSRLAGATVLASSREGLGIRGERLYQVPSLRTTDDGSSSEAARLFIDRATAVSPRLVLTAEAKTQIDRICRLLDGIPLAIELAAARMRILSPTQIAERLDDRFRLLTGGARAALPRQQTLEAAIDWSYRLLSPSERLLFDRLSVFVGGFTLDAVEHVCTDEQIDVADVLDLLEGLVDKSMVIADLDRPGVARYRMLETLRQYGVRRLGEDDGDLAGWKSRHLRFFADLARQRTPLTWDPPRHLDWYAVEHGNLSSALEWARSAGLGSVASLAAALAYHAANTAGDLDDALRLIAEGVEALEGERSTALRLRAYQLLLLSAAGRMEEIEERWSELRAEIDDADDEDAAWVLWRVSTVFAQDPELDAGVGLDLAREATRRGERLEVDARLKTLHALSWAMLWSNADPVERVDAAETAVELARRHGDDRRLLDVLSTLALACHTSDQRANTDLTQKVEDEMLEIWERRGREDRDEYVMWTGIRQGMWDLAEWEMEVEDRELRGTRRVQFLMPRACLRWMQGRLDEAISDLDEVDRLARVRRWHHDYYPIRAEVAASEGDLEATVAWVDRHFEVPMTPAEEIMRLGTLRALVMAHVDADDLDAARAVVDRMSAIAEASEIRIPTVQVGSEAFYLASAEAELSRLTGPDPDSWLRAERETFWVYWGLYCRVRQIEARHAAGSPVADAVDALRTELQRVGAMGLVRLLDRSTGHDTG